MASLIQEIENNESVLLMYLCGELPAEDGLEVEQMLAGDANLREELARIETTYQFAVGALAELDADRAAVAGENHAIRQAKRAMKQWQVDRLNRQPMAEPTPFRRVPSWAYPSAVAAMLLIGFLTYWGVAGDTIGTGGAGNGNQLASNKGDGDHESPPLLPPVTDEESKAIAAKAEVRLELSLIRSAQGGSEVIPEGISVAENNARSLTARSLMARSDDSAVASSIFWNDNSQ